MSMDIIKNKKRNIGNFERHFSECKKNNISENSKPKFQVYRFGQVFDVDDGELLECKKNNNKIVDNSENIIEENKFIPSHDIYKNLKEVTNIDSLKDDIGIVEKKRFKKINFLNWMVLSPIMLCLIVGGVWYFQRGMNAKKQVLGISKEAFSNIDGALDGLKNQDFSVSADKFNQAYENFSEISNSLESLGSGVIAVSRFIPGATKLSSGYYAIEAGRELSSAGEKASQLAKIMTDLKNKTPQENGGSNVSLSETFLSFEKILGEIEVHLNSAQNNLDKVKISDIPTENKKEITELKNKLPIITQALGEFSNNSHVIADFLGVNGPRKYLFLFQNNHEMRPTGGFIGSYGVLDIDSTGRIRKFFIDGIFNPDGQLLDKVVPPKPIQKISAAWSLHDSNWFPNFPTSAKKAMLFYEKTGGPTVDGVMTLTPTVMQELLSFTGPIEMKDYEVVLTKDNFIENIQYEVEEDYDQVENKPKKILSDLAPIVLDKVLNSKDPVILMGALNAFEKALEERHILFYFSNSELQKIVSDLGWSGEILETSKDYLSVINTNINGYKTDGVIEEKIDQQVDILENGEIISTVSITRKHNGGNSQYEWYNKVNADYMRVYVPEGSTLLEVEGQTREINENVLDYKSLSYEEDTDIKNEESQMKIDSNTGTRVYNESHKTVFANWVYVSPQEEVTVRYKYRLPFKVDRNSETATYSLLNQKQSGSLGDKFTLSLNYPSSWKEEWKSEFLKNCSSDKDGYLRTCFEGSLNVDKFSAVVFDKK
ncbi:MAG: DUF4012 domain-containing protein [Candidatus Moraniibacteriota bacterium]